MMDLMFDPEQQAAYEKEQEAFHAELKTLIEKAFKAHDTSGDKLLCKEEAEKFFANCAAEQALMAEAMMKMALCVGFRAEMKPNIEAGMVDASDMEAFKATMKANCAQALEGMKATKQQLMDGYNADKAGRNAAAFKVADVNGDGTLSLDEAISLLTPGQPHFEAFCEALGFPGMNIEAMTGQA